VRRVNWTEERLLPVESLLFRSASVKVGRFDCPADHPCFPRTAPLANDLLVLVRRPLNWRRGGSDFRFVEPGGALLHRAGRAIERRSVGPAGDRADWFGFRPAVFEEALATTGARAGRVADRAVSLPLPPALRWRAERLRLALDGNAAETLAVEETALALLAEVAAGLAGQGCRERPRRAATRVRRRRLADATRAWLDAHADGSHGLPEIAREVGASVYHLARLFRDEVGLSLHEYRLRQRLGRAIARLAADGPSDLSALALELGFSSHSHFSRVFRQRVGVAPSVLRDG
jgi:AraC family transcriptional regulator